MFESISKTGEYKLGILLPNDISLSILKLDTYLLKMISNNIEKNTCKALFPYFIWLTNDDWQF